MRVRTRDEQLLELWLTRRLMARLWRPLQQTTDRTALKSRSQSALVHPDAQDMMAQSLREESRRQADFSSSFDDSTAHRPLGELPMLVVSVDLRTHEHGQLETVFSDAQGRQVSLKLTDTVAQNVLTLMEGALEKSQWGLGAAVATAPGLEAVPAGSGRLLN